MPDEKHGGRKVKVMSWKLGMFFVFVPEFSDEARIFRRCHRAPLIQKIEDAQLFEINELKHSHIILIRYGFEIVGESFNFEEIFLFFENFGEVDLMQSLIGVIDEQLFKTIVFQNLEPIDIQETQSGQLLIASRA